MINLNEECKNMQGYMLKLKKGEKNHFPWKVNPRTIVENKNSFDLVKSTEIKEGENNE